MSATAVAGVLTIALWVILFGASYWILRRSRDLSRASRLLIGGLAFVGILVALKQAGDDPIPEFLVGQIIGSTFVMVLPGAIAVAMERRRRRSNPELAQKSKAT